MERVSDEGNAKCVLSVVVVAGSDGLRTEEDSVPLRGGGGMRVMVLPVSKMMVTITSAATV